MNGKTSGPAVGKIGKSEDLMLPYCAVYIDMPVQESDDILATYFVYNCKRDKEKRVCAAD
jgi:hypothetical protein